MFFSHKKAQNSQSCFELCASLWLKSVQLCEQHALNTFGGGYEGIGDGFIDGAGPLFSRHGSGVGPGHGPDQRHGARSQRGRVAWVEITATQTEASKFELKLST
jgi:hypothetical protein